MAGLAEDRQDMYRYDACDAGLDHPILILRLCTCACMQIVLFSAHWGPALLPRRFTHHAMTVTGCGKWCKQGPPCGRRR